MKIYLSYSRVNIDKAEEIAFFLKNEGINVFIDKDNIPGGDDWENHLRNRISTSDAIVLIWSKNAAESAYLMRELTHAKIEGRKIIPCSIDDENYLPLIKNLQHIKWLNNEASKKNLLESLGIKSEENNKETTYISAVKQYKNKIRTDYAYLKAFGSDKSFLIDDIYLPLNLEILNESGKKDQSIDAQDIVLLEDDHIAILGIPGSGKSTLINYLAYKFSSKDSELFPIKIRIAEFMQTNDKLIEYITQHIKVMIGKSNGNLISNDDLFCGKGTLLLLDGFDEILPNDQDDFLKRLSSFQHAHPDSKIIITSRFSGYIKIDGYRVCHLKELKDNDIEKYIWKVCDDSFREQLWNSIKNNIRILELARTPFLLSMMSATPANVGGKASQRAILYANCIKYLIQGKNLSSTNESEFKETKFTKVLEEALKLIAVRFFKLNIDTFEEEELLFILKAMKSNTANLPPQDILKRIYKYTGLLQKSGSKYYFIHRSIWEYFVAEGMKEENLDGLIEMSNIPNWEEPIRLFVGLSSERIFNELFEKLWKRNRGLTLRAMSELEIFPDKILEQLLNKLKQAERLRIIQQLEQEINSNSNDLESKRKILDTLGALLKVEKDCQIIYEAISLLEDSYNKWGDSDFQRLISNVLDLANSEKRLKKYIKNSNFYLDFVCIPKGSFIMGTNDKDRTVGEKPEHKVCLDSYCISKYQVTNKLYFDEFPFGKDKREERSNDDGQPVTYVTWYDAFIFSKWLGCDLPTEAEWEYACRSGGDDDDKLFNYNEIPQFAWYIENSGNKTNKVGKLKPNNMGLYDMLGNVREWCKDWFNDSYYQYCVDNKIINNPQGLDYGESKVLKGGCFDWNIANLVPTYRNYNPPNNSYFVNGFRLVYRGDESKLKK